MYYSSKEHFCFVIHRSRVPETDYADRFAVVSNSPPRQIRDNTSNQAIAGYVNALSNSLFTNHPSILCYVVSAVNNDAE
jgi:hypothetical protein